MGTLLTYVCDLALKGRETEINEQKIGQAVLGRSQDYDSRADGIVRSQASRLRQRLELYFQQKGADEPIRIVIPRRGYVPVFDAQVIPARPIAVAEPTEAGPEAVPSTPSRRPGEEPGDSFPWRWPAGMECEVRFSRFTAFWETRSHPT